MTFTNVKSNKARFGAVAGVTSDVLVSWMYSSFTGVFIIMIPVAVRYMLVAVRFFF